MSGLDHVKDERRQKLEAIFKEFVEATDIFDQYHLTGNVSMFAHISQGKIMKADIDYKYGIKLK